MGRERRDKVDPMPPRASHFASHYAAAERRIG